MEDATEGWATAECAMEQEQTIARINVAENVKAQVEWEGKGEEKDFSMEQSIQLAKVLRVAAAAPIVIDWVFRIKFTI